VPRPVIGQLPPGLGLRPHEALDLIQPVRPRALEEIRAERERSPDEADQRNRQPLLEERDRLEHEGERLPRVEGPEPLEVGRQVQGWIHDGTDRRLDLELQPRADERRGQIGEQDGGVDRIVLERKRRHLGGGLGVVNDLQEAPPSPDLPVARQRAPGLPHEPHGRPVDGLAP
jgi:hypothetical protein